MEEVIEEEKPTFMSKLRNLFKVETEADTGYKRKLLDGRIERYLDENFDNYIDEYGLVREIDLRKYEERYEALVEDVSDLKEFVVSADAEVGNFEHRLRNIEAAVSKENKQK